MCVNRAWGLTNDTTVNEICIAWLHGKFYLAVVRGMVDERLVKGNKNLVRMKFSWWEEGMNKYLFGYVSG